MSTILQTKDLSKEFDLGGGRTLNVLNGVNLRMSSKQFFALMGPSGSGKSTLLNIIGGLIPPSSGYININGKETAGMSDMELTRLRRHDVGWVFQDFNLIENLTALENVLIPMNLAGITDAAAEHQAVELLDRVGLTDRMDHLPDEMSGGQKQRVAIARALINDPPLLLADEPTGNLDSVTGSEIIELFKELAASGKAILMVSHDVKLAHAAQQVFILRNGEVVEEETVEDEVV